MVRKRGRLRLVLLYRFRKKRQAVTKKAVSGMASSMPSTPPNAVPQKKTATMMTTGWRPV